MTSRARPCWRYTELIFDIQFEELERIVAKYGNFDDAPLVEPGPA